MERWMTLSLCALLLPTVWARSIVITEDFDSGFGVFENYRPNITGGYWTYRYELNGEQGLVNARPSSAVASDHVAHLHSKAQFTTAPDMTIVARRYDESEGVGITATLYDPWNDKHLESLDFSESGILTDWYSSIARLISGGGETRKICIQGRGSSESTTSYISDLLLYIEEDYTGPSTTTVTTTVDPTGTQGTTVSSGTDATTGVTTVRTTTTGPTSSPTSCSLTTDGTSQVYLSPNFPDNFPAGATCTETISISGAAKVKATFNLFHVPSPLDPGCEVAYLQLTSGSYTERFCGYKDGVTRTFNTSIVDANFVGTAQAQYITDAQFKVTFTAA